MKSITIIALALAALSYCQADDDGQYRPEVYGDGRYYNPNDGYYRSLAERFGKYGSIYNAYRQPVYYQALNRELVSPLQVNIAESVVPTAFPAVTYRTPVVPTTFPAVTYRTPVVPVVSTYRPLVYSTPKPAVVAARTPSAVYLKNGPDAAASILREDRTFDENNYHYAYETDNGIAAEESGIVDSSANGVGGGTKVRGFYEYIGDDGLKYRVDYVADENGYRASGAHLPKSP